MTRIFVTLASLNFAALCLAFGFGLASQYRGALMQGDRIYIMHFALGLGAAVGTLLVHCLIFTYFLGTGRWVKEVGIAYDLADEPLPRTTRELKRRTFPPALAAMLVTIATAAAGMGRQMQVWPWQVHFALAIAALLVNVWAYYIEYRDLRLNAAILDQVLLEVDRIRAERGLPSNREALRQEGVRD